MNYKSLAVTLLFGLTLISCNKDEVDVCKTEDITYTNTIASIFNSSCALSGCHVTGNEMNAFFSLQGYDNAKAVANFGRIVGAVSHDAGFTPMPAGGDKLDQCSIDQISAWVDAGAPQ